MKYLLDTNALIGFLYKPDFLSVAAKNILENEDSLYVSIVSLWEIVVGTVLSFHFRRCNNTTFLRGHSGTTFGVFTKFSAFVIVIRNNSEPPLFLPERFAASSILPVYIIADFYTVIKMS